MGTDKKDRIEASQTLGAKQALDLLRAGLPPASGSSSLDPNLVVHVAGSRAFNSAETTGDNTTTNPFFLFVQLREWTLFYKQQTT